MKKYSIISILFIAIISFITYINTNTDSTFNIFGVPITLHNALWMAIFLFIFYLISITYFSIEKLKTFLFEKNINKDKKNLIKNIEAHILHKNTNLDIKELKVIQEFVEMIDGVSIKLKESDHYPVFSDIIKLQNGEVVDLKKYKLQKENPWVLKNLENKIKKGDKKAAIEALNTPLKKIAIQFLSKNADVTEILANDYPITKETILKNKNHPRLKELIDKSNLSNKEYIEIAQVLYKETQIPEKLLELFENKIVAYIYLLIEYEMIDKAFELAKEYDIKVFEYYLLLRKNGIKIDIKEYLNATI